MNLSRSVFCLFIALAFLITSGCGYNLRAGGEPVGIEIKSLAIPMVKSSSSEKGFEPDFTTVLRNEFIRHARVPLKNSGQAAMVLKVDVYEIATQPLTFDSAQNTVSGKTVTYETTSSRRLILKLNVNLMDSTTGKTVWSDASMTEEASFDVTSDPLVNRKNQQEALLKIAGLLSKKIYNRTMERF